MKYRRFGRTGWMASEIGYGMWGMGEWSGSDDAESLQSLQRSVELGCNFFDTAWAYGEGRSERLLGRLLRQNPGEMLYSHEDPTQEFQVAQLSRIYFEECFPPDHIQDYIHRSLKNVGVDCLDLIQFHTWEDGWLDDDRWAKKMDELRRQGEIRAVGISINRWEPWNGVKAVRSGLIDAVQVIYNIFDQNPEDELFPACQEKDVAVIARVPFDEGSLTGTLTLEQVAGDWRNTYFVPRTESCVEHAERLNPAPTRDDHA
jgi:aryl-alcohol dehydrogenase-like predicted oxidoreductase